MLFDEIIFLLPALRYALGTVIAIDFRPNCGRIAAGDRRHRRSQPKTGNPIGR
jgi:hypothetical protein